jgi:hypothetical protein
MVGTRRNLLGSNSNGQGNPEDFNKYNRVDLESGYGTINPVRPKQRFRDAVEHTMKENRAKDLKQKLIHQVDHTQLEVFRKSDTSV